MSLKSHAVVCLSKSPPACDTCLFSVNAWAVEGKDYYRGLFTVAETLSLAFSTSDVPLIVREATTHSTHIHSLFLSFHPAVVAIARGHDSVRRIPILFPGSSVLIIIVSSSKIIRWPRAYLGDRRRDEMSLPSWLLGITAIPWTRKRSFAREIFRHDPIGENIITGPREPRGRERATTVQVRLAPLRFRSPVLSIYAMHDTILCFPKLHRQE